MATGASATANATGSMIDPKLFYGYLFELDKKPTRTLDALLRGIAGYISENIGNKDQKSLTPEKLAGFYKAVGGNYDSLFVDVPNPSISWIYASIGCQHTLQPTTDDFQPPCIPALTTRGFVRWQSIEILLGPEEHVPFIQNAVRDFAIRHPDTGELFPGPVPKEAFPAVADPEIEKWHDQCAQELRKRATPTESESEARDNRPEPAPRPKVQTTYVHVRPPRAGVRPDTDYFERTTHPVRESFAPAGAAPRPIYQHVHSSTGRPVRPTLNRSPSHRARQFLAPEDSEGPRMARSRRRSFPENMSTSPVDSPPGGMPQPVRSPVDEPHVRRHSHPRHARRGSVSSDASSSEDGESPPSPTDTERRRRRRRSDYVRPPEDSPQIPPVGVRYSVPSQPPPGVVPVVDPRLRSREPPRDRERERGRVRQEDEEAKRRSFPIPIDLGGKLSAPFLLGKRDRHDARDVRDARAARSTSRSNGNVRWKDLDAPDLWRSSGGSMEEDDRPATGRRSGEYKRRERGDPRPERTRMHDRRSSHEDSVRRRSHSDRERDRDRDGVDRVSDRRSFRDRDRDRERERERRYVSPLRGVDGRPYPAH